MKNFHMVSRQYLLVWPVFWFPGVVFRVSRVVWDVLRKIKAYKLKLARKSVLSAEKIKT